MWVGQVKTEHGIRVNFKNCFRERLPEWIASVSMLLWGLIVLSEPAALWATDRIAFLAHLASQEVWGFTATGLGIIRLAALGINGVWRPTAHLRAIGAFLGCFLWTAIIISYLQLDWNPPSIGTKTGMLLLDLASLWYATADAKIADIKASTFNEHKKPLQA